MSKKSIAEVFELVENVPGDDQVAGVVARYSDIVLTSDNVEILVHRLNASREDLNQWKALQQLCEHMQRRRIASVRHQMEIATGAVMEAEGLMELAEVVKEHPVIFIGDFINSLNALRIHAVNEGESYTANLVGNRLKHLQLLMAAGLQNLEVTNENLKKVTYELLEARSFGDLLDRIGDNPVVLSQAFDEVLTEIAAQAGAGGDRRLPDIAKLRIDVLAGVREVLHTVVGKQAAKGGPEAAVEALSNVKKADDFLKAVAEYPFVLGEDFGAVLERERERAKDDKDDTAVAGIERRQGHLAKISRIVGRLTGETEEAAE